MTGTQPRPLRYAGRLNRRGRKATKMWLRAYADDMDRRWNEAEDMGVPFRGLFDEPLETAVFGVVSVTTAENVKRGDLVAVDDFGRAYKAGAR